MSQCVIEWYTHIYVDDAPAAAGMLQLRCRYLEVCFSVLQSSIHTCMHAPKPLAVVSYRSGVLQYVAECCSVLQSVANAPVFLP